jgi:hypothetical protein
VDESTVASYAQLFLSTHLMARENQFLTAGELSLQGDFHAVRARAQSVADATAQVYQGVAVGTAEGLERAITIGVSGGWFRTLGLKPTLGRTWDSREEAIGRENRLVVLSDGFWRRHFGAEPGVAAGCGSSSASGSGWSRPADCPPSPPIACMPSTPEASFPISRWPCS